MAWVHRWHRRTASRRRMGGRLLDEGRVPCAGWVPPPGAGRRPSVGRVRSLVGSSAQLLWRGASARGEERVAARRALACWVQGTACSRSADAAIAATVHYGAFCEAPLFEAYPKESVRAVRSAWHAVDRPRMTAFDMHRWNAVLDIHDVVNLGRATLPRSPGAFLGDQRSDMTPTWI